MVTNEGSNTEITGNCNTHMVKHFFPFIHCCKLGHMAGKKKRRRRRKKKKRRRRKKKKRRRRKEGRKKKKKKYKNKNKKCNDERHL